MEKEILEAMAAYVALGNTENEFADMMFDIKFGSTRQKAIARRRLLKLPHGLEIYKHEMGQAISW
jgi:hypothetical protein